jgi:hypothetical protein
LPDREREILVRLSLSDARADSGRPEFFPAKRPAGAPGSAASPPGLGEASVMIRHVLPRLRAGQFYRATGRFRLLREAYSRIEAARQRAAGGRSAPAEDPQGGVGPAGIESCIAALRAEGIHPAPRLAPETVAEIARYARAAGCARPDRRERFLASEVVDARLPDGAPAAVADVVDLMTCPAVRRVMADPHLLEIARRYLRYRPNRVEARLWWSFRGDLDPEERRRQGQAIDFHYDIPGYNAIYAYFYLSDVDRAAGPHVTIRGSHRGKPARMIFASTAQPEERVLRRYGAESALVIEGKAGTGFFEDPACFHKAAAPLARDRLVLQIRYS